MDEYEENIKPHKKFQFQAWHWLLLAIPIAVISYFTSPWVMLLYVALGMALIPSPVVTRGVQGITSDADKAIDETSELVERIIQGQKLTVSDNQKASLILEQVTRLKTLQPMKKGEQDDE